MTQSCEAPAPVLRHCDTSRSRWSTSWVLYMEMVDGEVRLAAELCDRGRRRMISLLCKASFISLVCSSSFLLTGVLSDSFTAVHWCHWFLLLFYQVNARRQVIKKINSMVNTCWISSLDHEGVFNSWRPSLSCLSLRTCPPIGCFLRLLMRGFYRAFRTESGVT